jgi:hypothetical protein
LLEKERLLNLDAAVALFALTKQMYRASEGSASEDQKVEEVKEVEEMKDG